MNNIRASVLERVNTEGGFFYLKIFILTGIAGGFFR